MRPNQTVITAAFLGYPLEAARVEICGRFASVENDREVYQVCRLMRPAFFVWQISNQATAAEVAAQVRELNKGN